MGPEFAYDVGRETEKETFEYKKVYNLSICYATQNVFNETRYESSLISPFTSPGTMSRIYCNTVSEGWASH